MTIPLILYFFNSLILYFRGISLDIPSLYLRSTFAVTSLFLPEQIDGIYFYVRSKNIRLEVPDKTVIFETK